MKQGIELYAAREPQHRRTWTLAAIVLVVLFFAIGGISTSMVMKAVHFQDTFGRGSWQGTSLGMIGTFGLASLLCFAWIKFFERRGLNTIGLKPEGLRQYGRGILLGFGFISLVVGLIYAAGGYVVEASGIASNFSLGAVLAFGGLFIGFMIQGATEEILMRGWLFQLIASRYGVMIGIVANMLIFSLLHAGNIAFSTELMIGLFNIVLVAILLSLYAWKEGSLWGVCAWHSAWNWLLGVGFGLEVSGQSLKVVPLFIDLKNAANTPVWLNGGAFGPEASVVTSAVLLLGIAYFAKQKGHGVIHGTPVVLTDTSTSEVNVYAEPADGISAA